MIGVGATLNERFTLDKELGQGGMGTVYRATDQVLGRTALGDEPARAETEGPAHDHLAVVHAEHHHAGIGPDLSHASQELEPAASWHRDVGDRGALADRFGQFLHHGRIHSHSARNCRSDPDH